MIKSIDSVSPAGSWSTLSERETESFKQPYNLTSDAAQNRLMRIRMISDTLHKQIKELSNKIEDITKTKSKDESDRTSRLETHFQSEYSQALLGIELAKKKQEEILLERQIACKDINTDVISQNELVERYKALNRRFVSAGGDLWQCSNKKLRLENPGAPITMQLDSEQFTARKIPELLLPLYKIPEYLNEHRKPAAWTPKDDLGDRKKPSNWIVDAMEYYSANPGYHGRNPYENIRWCHVSGTWYVSFGGLQPVAHIVPFLMDENKLEEIVFGSESESLQRPANVLLLQPTIQSLLERYAIVIVPVDRSEAPIKRWRTEFIHPWIKNSVVGNTETMKEIHGKDIEGRELSFLGERRPAPRFLYFHFIMALIRIKDSGKDDWQQVWAHYYEKRPFPSPGNYMRRSMLRALATYFDVADINVVESWMSDQGFDTELQILDDQAKELARRVHRIVDVDATIYQYDSEEELRDTYSDDEN